jgi:predicted nuclease of predicted toxin-antitoxin system
VAGFYADEQFPLPLVKLLRAMGHDILTVQEAGRANQRIPDAQVLADAKALNRVVLTQNRDDFFRLHRLQPDHTGIIACKFDLDRERAARNIDRAIASTPSFDGNLIRVNRSS